MWVDMISDQCASVKKMNFLAAAAAPIKNTPMTVSQMELLFETGKQHN